MITHKVTAGISTSVLGCYESFDSANEAAIQYVRTGRIGERVVIEPRYAEVRTTQDKLVVQYHGGAHELVADPGPKELCERVAMGWEVPK